MLRSIHACAYIIRPLVQRHGPSLKIQQWIPCPTTHELWSTLTADRSLTGHLGSLPLLESLDPSSHSEPPANKMDGAARGNWRGYGLVEYMKWVSSNESNLWTSLWCLDQHSFVLIQQGSRKVSHWQHLQQWTYSQHKSTQDICSRTPPKKMHAQKKTLHILMWNKSIQ